MGGIGRRGMDKKIVFMREMDKIRNMHKMYSELSVDLETAKRLEADILYAEMVHLNILLDRDKQFEVFKIEPH